MHSHSLRNPHSGNDATICDTLAFKQFTISALIVRPFALLVAVLLFGCCRSTYCLLWCVFFTNHYICLFVTRKCVSLCKCVSNSVLKDKDFELFPPQRPQKEAFSLPPFCEVAPPTWKERTCVFLWRNWVPWILVMTKTFPRRPGRRAMRRRW